jgi:ribosome-binding protein aMBF1 (putative translation factor)
MMIKNERQYRITRAQAEKFTQALHRATEGRTAESGVHPLLRKTQEDAIRSQLDDLRAELAEYESLIARKAAVQRVKSLEDLPRALIRARIAHGLSQKELAQRLGMKEQQIQRYEATEYASASLARVLEVARCLGVAAQPWQSA